MLQADEKPIRVKVRNSRQLGNAIKRFRMKQKLTQEQISENSSVRQASISQLEKGARGIRLSTLFKILAAMDMEIVLRKRRGNEKRKD